MSIVNVLKNCTVDGTVVKLPDGQLDRKLYMSVKKQIEGIGGKWKGGKVSGFVFDEDPTESLDILKSGESINIKKDFQFFRTPNKLADRLVELSEYTGNKSGDSTYKILEPSAGDGNLIQAIHRVNAIQKVYCVELMDINRNKLSKLLNVNLSDHKDFLEYDPVYRFDLIIANPPFTRNQDITHVRKMYDLLSPGGRLVSITSVSWTFGSQRKQIDFRDWLDDINARVLDIESGAFKESGTSVGGKILIIDKVIGVNENPELLTKDNS